ncbi:MAG TPA: hypothetical protein VHT30_00115 [Acidimicrobiales bacterium]|nr:hypothetical protein [Acidimicrobiales bacterium]
MLRRGTYNNNGALSLPKVPNRWLVTRILVDAANPTEPTVALHHWVVESDYLGPDETHSPTSIPQDPSQTPPYAFLGRVYDYPEWLGSGGTGPHLTNLTAMGFGIPDFAGYYPNCQNVFGLVDETLNDFDSPTAALGYAVTGWYANQTDDPLATAINGSDNAYGWLFSGPATPTYSLYHGAVWSLRWKPKAAYFPDFDTPIAPDIAIGNTPTEALSAHVVSRVGGFDRAETMLNALQLGCLAQLGQPDGLAHVDDALYDAAFASSPAGTRWDIQPAHHRIAPSEAKRHPLTAVPSTVAADLADLIDFQEKLDDQQAIAISLRRQIFADWQKFVFTEINTGNDLDRQYDFLQNELRALDVITGPNGTVAAFQAQTQRLRTSIEDSLPDDVELAPRAAPRSYEANDPVLLLTGDGVPPAPPDAVPNLSCVLTSDIVTGLELPAGLVKGSSAFVLDAPKLATLAEGDKLPYPAAAALIQSALLLDPDASGVLAAAVASQGGDNNPARLNFVAAEKAISAAQAAPKTPPGGVTFRGTLPQPEIALRTWTVPWNPVALSWEVQFQPPSALATDSPYDSDLVINSFCFDPESGNYILRRDSTFSNKPEYYQGTVLLSPNPTVTLKAQIDDYLRYVPNDSDQTDLQNLRGALDQRPFLAQALGGFTSSLLMLQPTMQLPIADRHPVNRQYATLAGDVAAAVGGENRLAANPDLAYMPLRAGKAVLTEIRLIDEFGRYKKLNRSEVVVSETIPVTSGPDGPELHLPLRLSQAARLDFRWLSATPPYQESTSLPASNPVCGWVVPNHLDGSLMFYDASGASVGTLTPSRSRPLWQSAPAVGDPSQTMEQSLNGRNPVLSSLISGININGCNFISGLIKTIDRTRIFIAPANYSQDNTTAVLLGAPLAVVLARVDLATSGLPSPNQSYPALGSDIERGDPLVRTTYGFPDVRFPVFLGSVTRVDDGLVGFFRSSASGTTDYSTFYAAAADHDEGQILRPGPATLTVAASTSSHPSVVTMLVDPRCPVHAFSGIAPIKTLDIPPHVYAAAAKAMSFTFPASPLLSLPGAMPLPVPDEADGDWTWVARGPSGWTETDTAAPNTKASLQTPQQVVEGWLKLTRKG